MYNAYINIGPTDGVVRVDVEAGRDGDSGEGQEGPPPRRHGGVLRHRGRSARARATMARLG